MDKTPQESLKEKLFYLRYLTGEAETASPSDPNGRLVAQNWSPEGVRAMREIAILFTEIDKRITIDFGPQGMEYAWLKQYAQGLVAQVGEIPGYGGDHPKESDPRE